MRLHRRNRVPAWRRRSLPADGTPDAGRSAAATRRTTIPDSMSMAGADGSSVTVRSARSAGFLGIGGTADNDPTLLSRQIQYGWSCGHGFFVRLRRFHPRTQLRAVRRQAGIAERHARPFTAQPAQNARRASVPAHSTGCDMHRDLSAVRHQERDGRQHRAEPLDGQRAMRPASPRWSSLAFMGQPLHARCALVGKLLTADRCGRVTQSRSMAPSARSPDTACAVSARPLDRSSGLGGDHLRQPRASTCQYRRSRCQAGTMNSRPAYSAGHQRKLARLRPSSDTALRAATARNRA